jgi:DNA-binding CsgD family transcriptional regulator
MERAAVESSVPSATQCALFLVAINALPSADRVWDAVSEEAVAIAQQPNDPESAMRALCSLIVAIARDGDREAGLRLAQKSLLEAEQQGDRVLTFVARRALGEYALHAGRFNDAIAHFRKRRELTGNTTKAVADEVYPLQLVDDFESSRALLAEAKRTAGLEPPSETARRQLAIGEMLQEYLEANFDRAAHIATAMCVDADMLQAERPLAARVILGRIAQVRGDYPAAKAMLGSLPSSRPGDDLWLTQQTLTQASLALSDGDHALAIERFRKAAKSTSSSSALRFWLPNWLVDGTRAALRAGDRGLAAEIVSFAQAIAGATSSAPSLKGVASQTSAMLAGDVAGVGRAAEALRSSPRPFVQAEVAVDYGSALLASGKKDDGVAQLDRAWELFSASGAYGEASRVQRLLTDVGIRRRRWSAAAKPKRGWAALTAPEQRVAKLLAEGHSNRSSARELQLTSNTIGSHARSIFTKLGIRSRVDLARIVLSESCLP